MVSGVYEGRLASVRSVVVGMVMSLVVMGCAEPGVAARQVSVGAVTGSQREQLDHYRHLITDANSPRTRQYGAELMLKTGWPEAIDELRAIMEEGKDSAARLAVAEAVAKVNNPPRDLIEPLIVLLGGSEEAVRQAAGAALASYKDSGVARRLGELARDEEADFSQRLGAINALSRMSDKSAIDAMIVLLDDDNVEIGAKTVAALHAATGIDEGQDARAWKQWWQENRNKTRQQWIRDVNASLTKRNKALEEQLGSLQKRLGRTLNECYQLTPELGRSALLLGWLKDPLEQVRTLGLELVTAAVKERRLLSEELAAQIRQMVDDPSSRVRETVMVVLRYPPNYPDDLQLILAQLRQETDSQVRQEILTTLGRLGDKTVLKEVIASLGDASPAVAARAAGSLAELVERGEVASEDLVDAIEPLKQRMAAVSAEKWELRQRFIDSMARIGDEGFAEVFASHLDQRFHPAIRQAAIRGLAGLGQPQAAGLLVKSLSDADPAVRRAAAEGLGRLGRPEHLEPLFEHLKSTVEQDHEVRKEAWKSFGLILSSAGVDQQLGWLKRMDPAAGDEWAERFVEAAETIGKNLLDRPSEQVWTRRTAAEALSRLGKHQEAAEQMRQAYEVVADSDSDESRKLGVAVVRYWLMAGQFDEAVAAAGKLLGNGSEQTTQAVLAATLEQLEALLAGGKHSEALQLLKRISNGLGEKLDDSWRGKFAEVQEQAVKLRREGESELIRQAISELRGANATQAANSIKAMGERTVPYLASELVRLVQSETPDPELEKAVLAIVREVATQWVEYPADADAALKLEHIKALQAAGE